MTECNSVETRYLFLLSLQDYGYYLLLKMRI